MNAIPPLFKKIIIHPIFVGAFFIASIVVAAKDITSGLSDILNSSPSNAPQYITPLLELPQWAAYLIILLSICFATAATIQGIKNLLSPPIRNALISLIAASSLIYLGFWIMRLASSVDFPLVWLAAAMLEYLICILVKMLLDVALHGHLEKAQVRVPAPQLPSAPILEFIEKEKAKERDKKAAEHRKQQMLALAQAGRAGPTLEEKKAMRKEAEYWRYVQSLPMRQRVLHY
ncbi:hypothetical protein J5N58_00365 [Rhizobium cremeum]|uniref:hypothetical protein n=1 Tax=Rhizobium cremeum TaxID=2813827 RepID=UPI000DE34D55|nr:hypothetical protein [Rhizobium cremeum]MCJ7993048.1 hypothetical protein [Rhizobium cremeum]MCJ7998113.1 hypothetical protein [Rhizobium cremeum]